MSWGRIVILDPELGAKAFESLVVELFSIVLYQCFWDSEPTDYGPSNEVAHFLLGDCCQWLGLSPFSEVVHSYNNELALTLPNRKGPEYVQSPLLKRLRAYNRGQWLG